MKRIETEEAVYTWRPRRNTIDWRGDERHYYNDGYYYTEYGVIKLLYYPPDAVATIDYKGKMYRLSTHQKVTRLGWARIAKRWADKIWKPRKGKNGTERTYTCRKNT